MTSLICEDLKGFTQALNENLRVDCSRNGEWYQEGIFMRFIRWLFGWEDARIVRVATAFNQFLDQLEKSPVKIREKFTSHFKAAEAVRSQLKTFNTKDAKAKLHELNLKIAALKYRLELVSKTKRIDNGVYFTLEKYANEWKEKNPNYEVSDLCPQEKEKLIELCGYPEFAKALIEEPDYRELFFKWALRDNCPIDAFVQFPATSLKIKQAYLGGWIGYFDGEIPLIKTTNFIKDYVLPMEVEEGGELDVKDFSVLDDKKEVNLAKGWKRSVADILAMLSESNKHPVDITPFGIWYNGDKRLGPRLSNWNYIKAGPYNPETKSYDGLDLTKEGEDWVKEVRPWNTLTAMQMKERFGLDPELNPGDWQFAANSTREDGSTAFSNCHGSYYAFRCDEQGRYEHRSFGKYVPEFPDTPLKKAFFITDTRKARIACPDLNPMMSQRQQAYSSHRVSKERGIEEMDQIRKDIITAKKGNFIFQFGWDNCAHWVQRRMKWLSKKTVPLYYRISVLESRPKIQPLPLLVKFCNKLVGKIQEIAVKILEFLMLAWRSVTVIKHGKKVRKSLMTSKHWKHLQIEHPAALHDKIIKKEIPGIVTVGNLFIRIQGAT